MLLSDFDEIKTAVKTCFFGDKMWYEKSLLFTTALLLTLSSSLLPYGFVLSILILPYLLFAKTKAQMTETKLAPKTFLLSARRYGRCFCLFVTKVLSAIFVLPFLSLTFSKHIQCDCKDLDFKGVLLLSRELARGVRQRIFAFGLFLLAVFALCGGLFAGATILLKKWLFLPNFAQITILFGGLFVMLAIFVLPVWDKYIENLYLRLKKEKIIEK